jgi:putative DNA primase/helicase
LNGDLRQLPTALAPLVKLPSWVLWRFERNKKGDKWTKVPYQANGRKASSDNPKTWSTYAAVIVVVDKFDGIGFCLLDSGLAAFDIDDCRDRATRIIDPWAMDLVNKCGSYTEITVSGTGLRIIGYGVGPKVDRKQPVANGVTVEPYRQATRYIVVTNNPLPNTPQQLVNIDAHIDAVVAELDGKKQKKKQFKPTAADGELPRSLLLKLAAQGDKPAGYPSRSELYYAFICEALRLGIDENAIVAAALDEAYVGNSIYEHVQDNHGEDYVRRQIERAVNEQHTDEKGRTIIIVPEGDTDATWRATQKALITHNSPVYVRNNRLVEPLWRWERGDDGSTVLTTRLEVLNLTRLTDIVAHRVVRFQKYDGRGNRLKNIDPPSSVITQLLGAKYWPLPTVVGIINAPTMRKDGSLLTEQGYDPQTKLWYKSSGAVVLPPIPEHPTRVEALAALAKLNELLVGFPFAKQKEEETSERCVARSVALAAMMTTALRGALQVAVPLFLVTATEPRTGKTYLVHVIAMLATGHIPPSTAGASEERPDEIEKRIETAALSGRPIMHLNNLPNGMVLDSARLAELCTEGHVNIRKLGKHEEGLCDCRATTVFLNGNNIRVAGDLVPRTLLCRLNAKEEEPETRTFDSDPIAQVRKDRSAYLAAIFTIVRAYKAAGCPVPAGMHSVAGFEDWSSLVQQPLMWLGMADPFGEITSMRAMDPTLEELTNLLNVLRNTFKEGDKFTVAMCQKEADKQSSDNHGRPYYVRQDLRDLMTFNGKLNARSFGRLLGKHLERIKDGWYYEPAGTVHGAAAYVLVRVPGQGQGQPQPPAQEEPPM